MDERWEKKNASKCYKYRPLHNSNIFISGVNVCLYEFLLIYSVVNSALLLCTENNECQRL